MLELRHLNALDDCDFDNPLGAPWEESRARGRSPGRAPIRSCADSYSASGAGASPPARHQATKSQSKSRRHARLTSMILTFREYPARIRVFQMLRNEQDAQGGRQSGRRAVSSLARPWFAERYPYQTGHQRCCTSHPSSKAMSCHPPSRQPSVRWPDTFFPPLLVTAAVV